MAREYPHVQAAERHGWQTDEKNTRRASGGGGDIVDRGAIVRLSAEDYRRVVRLWEDSVRSTHHFLRAEDFFALREEMPLRYLPAVDLYGFVCQGFLAGFLGVAGATIEMLFVHPDVFGRGVGKRLLHHAVHTLGARRVDVNRDNRPAREFYRRQGFRVVGLDAQDAQGRNYPVLHLETDYRQGDDIRNLRAEADDRREDDAGYWFVADAETAPLSGGDEKNRMI